MSALDIGDFEGGPTGGRILRASGDFIATLSPSSITKFLACPESYRQSYILGNWPDTYPAMILGTAYHYALRKNYEQKMWSGVDMRPEAVAIAFHTGWFDAENVAGDSLKFGERAPRETLYKLGVEMIQHYVKTAAAAVQPVGVEERIEWRVEGVPVPVIGYLDVRTDKRILDTKTIDKTGRMTTPLAKWRLAALIYMAAHADLTFEWHVHGKDDWKKVLTGSSTKGGLILYNTRARREAAEALVRTTWTQMTEMFGRYGINQPWPGHGAAHQGYCGQCFHRRSCSWQR